MTTQNFQKVFSTNSKLQAIAVQAALEQAGIPASNIKSQTGALMDVLVPEEFAQDARSMLFPQPKAAEIIWPSRVVVLGQTA